MTNEADWKIDAEVELVEGTTYENEVGTITKSTDKMVWIRLKGGRVVRVPKTSAKLVTTKKKKASSSTETRDEDNSNRDEVPSLVVPEDAPPSSPVEKETDTVSFAVKSPVQIIGGQNKGKSGVVVNETPRMVRVKTGKDEVVRVMKSNVKRSNVKEEPAVLPTPPPSSDQLRSNITTVPQSEIRPKKLFQGRKSLEKAIQSTSKGVRNNKILLGFIALLLIAVSFAGKHFYSTTLDLDGVVSSSADYVSEHGAQVVANATAVLIIASHGLQKILTEAMSFNWLTSRASKTTTTMKLF